MNPANSQNRNPEKERKKKIIAPSSPQQEEEEEEEAGPLLFDILPLEELPCRRLRLFFTDDQSSITLPTKVKRK
jgi:hypothetical protein